MSDPKNMPENADPAAGDAKSPGFNDPASESDRALTDVEGDPGHERSADVEAPSHDTDQRAASDVEDEIGYFAERRVK